MHFVVQRSECRCEICFRVKPPLEELAVSSSRNIEFAQKLLFCFVCLFMLVNVKNVEKTRFQALFFLFIWILITTIIQEWYVLECSSYVNAKIFLS